MIMHFAESVDSGVLIGALFAGLVPMFAGFYAFAKYVLNNSRDERKEERDVFLSTIKETNVTISKLSENIKMQHDYDVKHNGTSDELVAKSIKAISTLNDSMKEAGRLNDAKQEKMLQEIIAIKIRTQKVGTQNVKHQVVQETHKEE